MPDQIRMRSRIKGEKFRQKRLRNRVLKNCGRSKKCLRFFRRQKSRNLYRWRVDNFPKRERSIFSIITKSFELDKILFLDFLFGTPTLSHSLSLILRLIFTRPKKKVLWLITKAAIKYKYFYWILKNFYLKAFIQL